MIAAGSLLAIGFVHPLLLGGLSLAAVPLIIHLLSRRRYTVVEWGATRFLLEAERENRRRVQFEQWLLVALRCLAMALLALLISRPFAESQLVASLLGGPILTQRIIVLDDSASLANRGAARDDFEPLKAAADRLIQWLQRESPGDRLTVYRATAPDEPLVEDLPLRDPRVRDTLERIARLEPAAGRAAPQRVFTAIREQLRPNPTSPAEIVLLSDFQRTDWLVAGENAASVFAPLQAGRDATEPLPALRIILVSSGAEVRPNIAIGNLQLARPLTVAGLPAMVTVELTNYTGRTLPSGTLQIQLDDAPQPAVTFEAVEAGATRSVSFETTVADEGWRVLSVGLGALDGFPPDDTRRIGFRTLSALNVLIVNGQPAADRAADEAHLLRNAITPPGPFSSGVRVDTIDPDEIESADLSRYDVILLCNVAPPEESAIDALQRFVRGGGGLVFFLGGELADITQFNKAFFADGRGLSPVALDTIVDLPNGAGLIRSGLHPVTAMFPDGGEALSEYVRFRRFFRATVPAPDADDARPGADDPATTAPANAPPAAVVLARFSDDDKTPALIERPFGRGRVLLFTSTIDLDWNDWARTIDGSYVVTLLEMIQYVARRSDQSGEYLGGQPLNVTLLPDRYELRALLKTPAYPSEPALEVAAPSAEVEPGVAVTLKGPPAERLGVYRIDLTTRTGEIETRPLAVNLDPLESDLTVATRAGLSAALGDLPHQFAGPADDFLRDEAENRRELWPALLLLLVATLMLEQTLAWRFGSQRSSAGKPSRLRAIFGSAPQPAVSRPVETSAYAVARDQR